MGPAVHKRAPFRLPLAIELTASLLAQRRFSEVGRGIASRVYKQSRSFGMRRDLATPFEPPQARIPIEIRQLRAEDIPVLFEEKVPVREAADMITRRRHLAAGIPQCYVAIDARNGTPCAFQWLMGPEQNAAIAELFGPGWFPPLRSDEALLENAYTTIHYRGYGIGTALAARVSAYAADLGCRYVYAFIAANNAPSLHACSKAGFSKYLVRDELELMTIPVRRVFSIYESPAGAAVRTEPSLQQSETGRPS
uniref:GCN5-related N-acetyltransferase n=1 Tax=Rhodopseudomonas palustris (strain BisA53) TaxID=316055 RepID=Q07KU7_RHOP5